MMGRYEGNEHEDADGAARLRFWLVNSWLDWVVELMPE